MLDENCVDIRWRMCFVCGGTRLDERAETPEATERPVENRLSSQAGNAGNQRQIRSGRER